MTVCSSNDILKDLNDVQKRAVTFGAGPLLVLAGAGSGKTRVITRRVAWLVHEGVQPDKIVAITFTNKAATEIRRRVENLVGSSVRVQTFHTFCARLLRRDVDRLGRNRNFTIYDRTDSIRTVRSIIKRLDLDPGTYKPADVLDRIGAHKDRIEAPEDAKRDAAGPWDEVTARVYEYYENTLLENNALDFDDLLVKTVKLFSECPEVLQKYQEMFQHVLVDEYQDTNLPQHLIARALQGKHRNITAVGDPDQMIYSWRGARLDNMMEFEEDFPGASVIKLEQNYRSTANILNAASASIAVNANRHEKKLWTSSGKGEPVRVMEFKNTYQEAEWVAETVERLKNEKKLPLSEIAILYRTKYQSLPFEEAFSTRSLPHQVVDTVGFFDRQAVRDVLAYLRLLVNPKDAAALARIINVPSRGIGAKTWQKIQNIAENLNKSPIEVITDPENLKKLPTRAEKSTNRFRTTYERLLKIPGRSSSIYALIKDILSEINYINSIPDEDRESVEEILDYLLAFARQYDQRHPDGDLVGFMERSALLSDVDGWEADADAVSLMTLHSAKGLEFDAVFLVGVEEGILPHSRALQERIHGDEDEAIEEERRLFHVGMTRARKYLYITHANIRMIRGREEFTGASGFLSELPQEGVERYALSGYRHGKKSSAQQFQGEVKAVINKKRNKMEDKKIKKNDTISPLSGNGEIKAGDRINHPRYGEGEVIKLESAADKQLARINFKDFGVLNLLL
jgi:DNA helicase-2/ATP-dependent DNA helicase PcrA